MSSPKGGFNKCPHCKQMVLTRLVNPITLRPATKGFRVCRPCAESEFKKALPGVGITPAQYATMCKQVGL